MTFLPLACQIWSGNDFTPCFRQNYLRHIIPLIIPVVVLAHLAASQIHRCTRKPVQPQRNHRPDTELQAEENVTLDSAIERLVQRNNLSDKPKQRLPAMVRLLGSIGLIVIAWLPPLRTSDATTLMFLPFWLAALAVFERVAPRSRSSSYSIILATYALIHVFCYRTKLIASHSSPSPFDRQAYQAFAAVAVQLILLFVPYASELDGLLAGRYAGKGAGPEKNELTMPNLDEPRSIMSRLFFVQVITLICKNRHRSFEEVQVPSLREDDVAAASLASFRVKSHPNRHFALRLLWHYRSSLAQQVAWTVCFTCCSFVSPLALQWLLRFVKHRRDDQDAPPVHTAFISIACIFAGQMLHMIASQQAGLIAKRTSIRAQAVVIGEIYTKALRMASISGRSEDADDQSEARNQIVNLVANDAAHISNAAGRTQHLLAIPLYVTIDIYLLSLIVGAQASLAAFLTFLLLIPIQACISGSYNKAMQRIAACKDKRLHLINEVFNHMKLIKFQAWETHFLKMMRIHRAQELLAVRSRFVTSVFHRCLVWGSTPVVIAVTFSVYAIYLGKPLTVEVAFPAISLIAILQPPIESLTVDTIHFVQAYIAASRVHQFLQLPETTKYEQLSTPQRPSDPVMGCTGATLSHYQQAYTDDPSTSIHGTLTEVNLSFPPGQLSIILGPTGSGKSMLLNGLLGELRLETGSIFMQRSVAFCGQTPWLLSGSVKANILFGSEHNHERYLATIHACALNQDLQSFQNGDATAVGEKGRACSGGQKARIALARAVYSSTSVLILDDIFASVDVQTASRILRHCLRGPLLKDRTIILATNSVALLLPHAQFAVILRNCRVEKSGAPADLSTELRDLAKAAKAEESDVRALGTADNGPYVPNSTDCDDDDDDERPKYKESQSGVFRSYLIATGSYWFALAILGAFTISQIIEVASKNAIRIWAESTERADPNVVLARYYLVVYTSLVGAILATVALRNVILNSASLRASATLYDSMIYKLMSATMRFHEITPLGQILSRLSRDIDLIDIQVPLIVMGVGEAGLLTLATGAVIAFFVPLFLVPAILLTAAYIVTARTFIPIFRRLQQLENATRAQLLLTGEISTQGIRTIRAFGQSSRFVNILLNRLDDNSRVNWALNQTQSLLAIICVMVGSTISLIACAFAITSVRMDAGAVGMSVSYCLLFSHFSLWTIRHLTDSEEIRTSLERYKNTLENMMVEPAAGIVPPPAWPSADRPIVIKDLTCSYAPELPPVLSNVSFTIGPREKIGVCGRTGSGKSSLALSMFRMLHQVKGSIEMDGIDVAQVNLENLRSRLTMLPQDPELLEGTIRYNLDSAGTYSDSEIWEALQICGIKQRHCYDGRPGVCAPADTTAIMTIDSLDQICEVDGRNWSHGERQMLTLARAMLTLRGTGEKSQPRSLLIMDEGTAHLDREKDRVIGDILKNKLADKQMIVIGHRLSTICGLDKILVLDKGKAVAFGTPLELYNEAGSIFRSLCEESGDFEEIKKVMTGGS